MPNADSAADRPRRPISSARLVGEQVGYRFREGLWTAVDNHTAAVGFNELRQTVVGANDYGNAEHHRLQYRHRERLLHRGQHIHRCARHTFAGAIRLYRRLAPNAVFAESFRTRLRDDRINAGLRSRRRSHRRRTGRELPTSVARRRLRRRPLGLLRSCSLARNNTSGSWLRQAAH